MSPPRDKGRNRDEDSTPRDYIAQTTPEATSFGRRHDDTQLMQMMMEIHHDLGRIAEKVDGINTRLDKTESKVSKFNDTVTYLKGGLVIGGAISLTMIGLFWFFVGDKITEVVKGKPASPSLMVQPQQPTNFPAPSVPTNPPAPTFKPPGSK